jgi:hypothetical protein
MPDPIPALTLVAKHPEVLNDLPVTVLAAVAAQCCATIATRLAEGGNHEPPDRMLTAEEAAPLTGLTPRYLRRHAKTLAFAIRSSEGRVRFSQKGIAKWADNKLRYRG